MKQPHDTSSQISDKGLHSQLSKIAKHQKKLSGQHASLLLDIQDLKKSNRVLQKELVKMRELLGRRFRANVSIELTREDVTSAKGTRTHHHHQQNGLESLSSFLNSHQVNGES
jgi:hypothetical protein